MTQYTPEQLAWIEELETTDEPQARGRLWGTLQDGRKGFCCLGVAEQMLEPESSQLEPAKVQGAWGPRSDGVGANSDVQEKLQLRSSEGRFLHLPYENINSLASLNDTGWTFKQIAKILRTYPGMVFINFPEQCPTKEELNALRETNP